MKVANRSSRKNSKMFHPADSTERDSLTVTEAANRTNLRKRKRNSGHPATTSPLLRIWPQKIAKLEAIPVSVWPPLLPPTQIGKPEGSG